MQLLGFNGRTIESDIYNIIPRRRTMEIIEEQKYRFALYDSQKGAGAVHAGATAPPRAVVLYKSNARVQEVQAPPKSLATSHAGHVS